MDDEAPRFLRFCRSVALLSTRARVGALTIPVALLGACVIGPEHDDGILYPPEDAGHSQPDAARADTRDAHGETQAEADAESESNVDSGAETDVD